MAQEFAVKGIEDRLVRFVCEQPILSASGFSLVEAMQFRHIVMEWVSAQPKEMVCQICQIVGTREATEGNIHLLDGLWELCAKHGIVLDVAAKIALYQDLLED